jgi:hypothetical protein
VDRDQRLKENQERFRRGNLAIEHTAAQMGACDEVTPFLCECSNAGCLGAVNLRGSDYAGLRAHPNQYIVLPGHQTPGVDTVVGTLGDYVIVEKTRLSARGLTEPHNQVTRSRAN